MYDWTLTLWTQMGFIILAGIAACLYFVFLCYMVFNVFRNIGAKRSAIPTMVQHKRKFYLVSPGFA